MESKAGNNKPVKSGADAGRWRIFDSLRWWHFALIAAAALFCYIHTAGYGFVYDDKIQIVRNPRITSFDNLGKAFSENFWAFRGPRSTSNYFRPLQTVTYMLGYAVGKLSPAPYHWISIILHVLSCLAVYWAGAAFLGTPAAAFLGALLFAVHPMHTESVSWVAGVTDVGCCLFYMLSLGAYIRLREADRLHTYGLWALSLCSFFCALLYKEMAFTLPIVIVMLDFACDTGHAGLRPVERFKRLLPFLAVMLAYFALRSQASGVRSHTSRTLPISLPDRLMTTGYLVGHYIQDLLLPVAQNAYRVFEPFSRLGFTDWLLPLALLGIAAWLGYRYLRNDRKLLFLALFVVITLIPVLDLGAIGDNKYTERYLYIPSVGFCLLVAALIVRCRMRRTALALAALWVVVLAGLTVRRNPIWKDDELFYRTTLAASPEAVPLRNNLAALLMNNKDYSDARKEFLIALDSTYRGFMHVPQERAGALLGLSAIDEAEGNLREASKYAEEALRVIPDLPEACLALGMVKGRMGDNQRAAGLLREALKSMPDNALAHLSLGNVLLYSNDLAGAEVEYREATRLDPKVNTRILLALVLSHTNRGAEAASMLKEILSRDPANLPARQLLEQINASSASPR